MANLFAIPWRPVMQNNLVVAGAKIYFTLAGTNTASAPFSNSTLTTARTNPVIADGTGKIPTTYLDPAKSYRVRIYSRSATVGVDTPIEEYDPYVPGVFADADALEPVAEAAAASAASAAGSAASAAAALLSLLADDVAAGLALPRITPEMYAAAKTSGVTGDGTDDSPALVAMWGALNAIGRGVVDYYPGRTYWVGTQTANAAGPAAVSGATMRYAPDTPYPNEISGCTGPVVVNMNGAKIKCLAGKHYGSFNADGTDYVGQATLPANAATPYFAMLYVHDCSGGVFVAGGELDGNIAAADLGGGYGDFGIQFPKTGVLIGEGNTGPVRIFVNSHHHGLDSATIDADGALDTIDDIDLSGQFNNSGRQGVSLVGGVGVTLGRFGGIQCKGAGKDIGAMTYSPLGAGVDLEAEGGKYVVGTKIYNPDIYDNSGPGILMAASATNSYKLDVYDGKLVGTTSWAHWLDRPEAVLHGTEVLGAFVNAYNSADATQAFRHIGGKITDDISLSPTGVLYNPSGVMVSGSVDGIQFDRTHWLHTQNVSSTNGGTGNFSTGVGMRLHNCFVENTVAANFLVYGIYSGHQTHIKGANTMPDPGATTLFLFEAGPALDSYSYENNLGGFAIALARYPGNLDALTGKRVYYGTATYNPPSLAAAAKDTIQTMTVTGVALGDKVDEVSFSLNLAGARIHAWVSAANTVSYYAINENGANPLDLASGTLRVKVSQS